MRQGEVVREGEVGETGRWVGQGRVRRVGEVGETEGGG